MDFSPTFTLIYGDGEALPYPGVRVLKQLWEQRGEGRQGQAGKDKARLGSSPG